MLPDDSSAFHPKLHDLYELNIHQCVKNHSIIYSLEDSSAHVCQAAYSHFVRRGVLDDFRTEVGAMNGASVQVKRGWMQHSNVTGGFMRDFLNGEFVNYKGL